MFPVDWNNLKEEDLKDKEYLVKVFGKFLKKDCKYSAAEAKFAADVIEEPFARNYNSCKKTFDATRQICSRTYEVFFCSVKDSSPKLFEFYTLVDVDTKTEAHFGDELLPYIFAKKKFIFPNE